MQRALFLLGLLTVIVFFAASRATADVIVLTNRTTTTISAQILPLAAAPFPVKLAPDDVLPVFVDGRAYIDFTAAGEPRHYLLDANSAYYFGKSAQGQMDLQKIGLGEDKESGAGRPLPGRAGTASPATILVKILVDEEQPAKQSVWEPQLRKRIAAASAILEKYARVQLKVVAVDTWETDNSINEFYASLAEFEKKVKPFPAQLAIGFTSQYSAVTGRVHLAGTRGPLATHIFVREWSQHISEPERLELLVHELGHFLGASHSPEQTSVMRPVLGNHQAVRIDFQVRFDPVNALIIGMVGEELGRRKIQHWSDMTAGTKKRLEQIYGALSQTMPTDPAAGAFIKSVKPAMLTSLALDTKKVLTRLTEAAQANAKLPMGDGKAIGNETRRQGDSLTEYLVRQAAEAAKSLPADTGPTAFLFALGIGLDDSNVLRIHPKTGPFIETVEPMADRAARLAALGMETATETGLAKEMMDSEGSEGFSFVDMTANRAGILFAGGVMRNAFPLATLADSFTVAGYMPAIDGIPENLSAMQLMAKFGLPADARFQKQLQAIDERVMELPAYHVAEAAKNR
jgi:hypothetical protein